MISDNKRQLRKIDQKQRLLKLSVLTNAFRHYTQAELKRALLNSENTWKSAERTADLINFFFKGREAKATDFMYEKSKLVDESINHYEKFRQWIRPAIVNGISEEALTAFCKRVEKTPECWMLKITSGLHYPYYLDAFYQYINGEITKDDLKKNLTEIDIFSKEGNRKPANMRLFRRCIVRMESIFEDIQKKQKVRKGIDISDMSDIISDLSDFDKLYKEIYKDAAGFVPSIRAIVITRSDISDSLCKVYPDERKYTNRIYSLIAALEKALGKIDFDYPDLFFQPFLTGDAVYYRENTNKGEFCKNYILLECRLDIEQLKEFFDDLELFINEEKLSIDLSSIKDEVTKIYRRIPVNKLDERLPKILSLMSGRLEKAIALLEMVTE